MPLPTPAQILKTHLDNASDNPSLARAELLNLADRLTELLESLDQAGGIPKLTADTRIQASQLFDTDPSLRLGTAGGRRTLEHTSEPQTPQNVAASSGQAITGVQVDAKGHVLLVEKGDVTSLDGPFYTPWHFHSTYDVVRGAASTRRRPASFSTAPALSGLSALSSAGPLQLESLIPNRALPAKREIADGPEITGAWISVRTPTVASIQPGYTTYYTASRAKTKKIRLPYYIVT